MKRKTFFRGGAAALALAVGMNGIAHPAPAQAQEVIPGVQLPVIQLPQLQLPSELQDNEALRNLLGILAGGAGIAAVFALLSNLGHGSSVGSSSVPPATTTTPTSPATTTPVTTTPTTTTPTSTATSTTTTPTSTATTTPATTTPTTTTPTSTPAPVELQRFEEDFLAEMNAYRAASGAPALTLDAKLQASAEEYAKKSAEAGELIKTEDNTIGQLLGGYSSDDDAAKAFSELQQQVDITFLKTPRLKKVGVAVVQKDGMNYIVAHYGF